MSKHYLIEIIKICTSEFDVSIDDMISNSRVQKIVYCRKAYSILVKEALDINLDEIGSFINKTGSAVSFYISNQPNNKYYKLCIEKCRKTIQEKLK